MQQEVREEQEQLSYFKIGGIIRKYRKEKELKLLDLAALTGIGSAMLSKIENGRMIPTIPTLFTIIHKLGIAPEAFFAQLNTENLFPGYYFLPKKLFSPYEKEESASGFQYFSILEHTSEGGAFQISLLELQHNASRPQVTTMAFEFIYILKGRLSYQLDDKTFEMEEGDALFFDGNIPHVPVNNSGHTASLLVLYLFTNSK
ncbi:transcriptional regulator, XRE family with cupin sensor [Filimonas lacunae]|uniref:Transcriptional regulator, XRE family with cupin sensor n=1 Tax=Filimonas lacunae TaxID=477680 RepID=A0A173M996_9BACT|nr:XRE family transcriptional regulator [Filimonas lacunae]BAV04092.1 transcriptional regulator [Filimonas lacunae]SIT15541.1 transcriptional regulator, XRE family with cupin sensor [Filimonas lacunae]